MFLGLVTAAQRDPELATLIDSNLLEVPRRALREVFDRGVRRGEIPPDRDLTLVPDMILGLNFIRSVTGKPLDRRFIRRVFDDRRLAACAGSRRPGAGRNNDTR